MLERHGLHVQRVVMLTDEFTLSRCHAILCLSRFTMKIEVVAEFGLVTLSSNKLGTTLMSGTGVGAGLGPHLLRGGGGVEAGGSIGATLRAAGFTINKQLLIKTETAAGDQFVSLAQGSLLVGAPLYTKVYALFAQQKNLQIPYAVIAEAYHPEHFPPNHKEFSEEPTLQKAADRALATLRATINQRQAMKSPAA